MKSQIPSAENQLQFLQQIQRLFQEGEFAATYKYALLLSLAELAVEAVEYGDDSGSPLPLELNQIAEKFAELYWRQISPYQSGQPHTEAHVLRQNLGAQAAVVRHLKHIHAAVSGRFTLAKNHPSWKGVIKDIVSIVQKMPLRYLQNIGGSYQPFLYEYPPRHGKVELKPGIAFNLRCYQSLIQHLARSAWVEHVRSNKLNAPMLGSIDDLETFMFGSARASLKEVAHILAPIQSSKCFYCGGRLTVKAEVDHFIPWSRYPRDTAHNFVLAHRGCNNDKRSMLAARKHLDNWLEGLNKHGAEIGGLLLEKGFVADIACSTRVAHWAYHQLLQSHGDTWVSIGTTEPINSSTLDLFSNKAV